MTKQQAIKEVMKKARVDVTARDYLTFGSIGVSESYEKFKGIGVTMHEVLGIYQCERRLHVKRVIEIY